MCRNIKRLRDPLQPPSDDELRLPALQFVRKGSAYHSPPRTNAAAFQPAVAEISAATRRLLDGLVTSGTKVQGSSL